MNKKAIFASVFSVLVLLGVIYFIINYYHKPSDELILNGNVDIRQVSLSFDGNGHIKHLNAEEGNQVRNGQILGVLDTESLQLQAAAAQADIKVQNENLSRLKNGPRPQEILQGKSRVHAAQAKALVAKNELARLKAIATDTAGKGTSAQEIDKAQSTAKVADAELAEQQEALRLLQEGSRKEDIAAAQGQLNAAQAKLNLLKYQISLGTLKAPADGTIRSRLLEPGDMGIGRAHV